MTSSKRTPALPDVPTVSEAGVPGFDVLGLVCAASRRPRRRRAIIAKFHADTVAALADPAIRARLDQLGVGVVGSTPEELARVPESRDGQVGPIIKEAGIKVE